MNFYFNNSNKNKSEEVAVKKPKIAELYEWVDAVVLSVIVIILLFTFVFRIVGIQGESMMNTLNDGDRVVISDLFYSPKRGDVVVISRNYLNENGDTDESDSPIIKRVIATEGQTVRINPITGSVYVDGKELDEDYVRPGAITTWNDGSNSVREVVVEEGKIFVMGDNRNNSADSRSPEIGQIDVKYVLGKALFRIYPFNSIGGL